MKKLLSLFAILLLAATSYAQNKIDGVWTGKLNAGTQTLTIVIHVNHDANGNATGDGTFCYRHIGAGTSGSRSEATDYVTEQRNTVNRGSIYTGYEIGVSTSLNNGNDTPLFKSEVVTPSRLKWNPLSILGYAYSDAGNLQVIDVEGTNYLTLGNSAGQYADVSLQQYACLAIAYY